MYKLEDYPPHMRESLIRHIATKWDITSANVKEDFSKYIKHMDMKTLNRFLKG